MSYYDLKLKQALNKIDLLSKRVSALEKDRQQVFLALTNDKTAAVPLCICGKLNCKTWHDEDEMSKIIQK